MCFSSSRYLMNLQELDAAQTATRLLKVPGLHSYLGWCFFFPSILVGPSFDFSLYNSLAHNTLFLDPPATKDSVNKNAAPGPISPVGRKRVAFVHMAVGLAFLGFFAALGGKATYAGVLSPSWYSYGIGFR